MQYVLICSNVKAQDSVLVTFLFLHLTDFLNPALQWFQHKCFTNVGRIYLTYNCSFLPVNKSPPQKKSHDSGKEPHWDGEGISRATFLPPSSSQMGAGLSGRNIYVLLCTKQDLTTVEFPAARPAPAEVQRFISTLCVASSSWLVLDTWRHRTRGWHFTCSLSLLHPAAVLFPRCASQQVDYAALVEICAPSVKSSQSTFPSAELVLLVGLCSCQALLVYFRNSLCIWWHRQWKWMDPSILGTFKEQKQPGDGHSLCRPDTGWQGCHGENKAAFWTEGDAWCKGFC